MTDREQEGAGRNTTGTFYKIWLDLVRTPQQLFDNCGSCLAMANILCTTFPVSFHLIWKCERRSHKKSAHWIQTEFHRREVSYIREEIFRLIYNKGTGKMCSETKWDKRCAKKGNFKEFRKCLPKSMRHKRLRLGGAAFEFYVM